MRRSGHTYPYRRSGLGKSGLQFAVPDCFCSAGRHDALRRPDWGRHGFDVGCEAV